MSTVIRSKDYYSPKFNKNVDSEVITEITDSKDIELGINLEGVQASVHFDMHYIPEDKSDDLYDYLTRELDWQQREGHNNFGGVYKEPRLTYWLGKPYKYSSVVWGENNKWNDQLERLRNQLSEDPNLGIDPDKPLNSVMCNWYRDGNDSIGWHADDETSLGRCPTIASISLGDTRFFDVCKREDYYSRQGKPATNRETFSGCSKMYRFHLNNGSLLLMTGSVQDDWLHRVPKGNRNLKGRINLTFRHIVNAVEERMEVEFKKQLSRAKRMQKIVRLSLTNSNTSTDSLGYLKRPTQDKQFHENVNKTLSKNDRKRSESANAKWNFSSDQETGLNDKTKETKKSLKRKNKHLEKDKVSENCDSDNGEKKKHSKKKEKMAKKKDKDDKKKKKKKKKEKKEQSEKEAEYVDSGICEESKPEVVIEVGVTEVMGVRDVPLHEAKDIKCVD